MLIEFTNKVEEVSDIRYVEIVDKMMNIRNASIKIRGE